MATAEASTRPETLPALVLGAAARHHGVALRSTGTHLTYAGLGAAVRDAAAALVRLGVRPGDRVAVLGETRPEWTLADCAALCAGAVVVPVYQTSAPDECRYIVEHAGARVAICESEAQRAKLESAGAALEHVIGMPALVDAGPGTAGDASHVDAVAASVTPDSVATIVYTSGTTGPPKGCELTHRALVSTVRMYEDALSLRPGIDIFMFLPLAHALARVVQFVALDVGATLSFWSRDAARLLDDLATLAPTHLPCVPRVLEKVHARALAQVEDGPRLRRALVRWALATGAEADGAKRSAGHLPGTLRARHAVADRLVLRRIRSLFGDRLELTLTGAAPIAPEVLTFFSACGMEVLEGYGLTESCAAATLNRPGAALPGSVGAPLPGCAVRIAQDGEVLLTGPMLFRGYRHDAAATASALEDGWLHTGDLGVVDAEGRLAITGRKKDLIVTSSGKNISPANLESGLRESRWIGEAVVFGDRHPFLVALVTLDEDALPALAARCGCPPDRRTLAGDPRVVAEIQAAVDGVNAGVSRISQIKRFAVLDEDLTREGGELTPTLKVKREIVGRRHADRIAALYARD